MFMWISGLTTLTLFTSLTQNVLKSVIQTDQWTKQMVVFSQLLQWHTLAHSNWVQYLERSELHPIQIIALHWPTAVTVSLMSKHSAASLTWLCLGLFTGLQVRLRCYHQISPALPEFWSFTLSNKMEVVNETPQKCTMAAILSKADWV